MKWTQIPESLAGLSADALRILDAALKDECKTNAEQASTQEELDEVRHYRAERKRIQVKLAAVETIDDETPAPVEPIVEPEIVPADEVEVIAPVVDDTPIPTGLSVETTVETTPAPIVRQGVGWKATDNTPGKDAGEMFDSYFEIAQALQDQAQLVGDGSDKKHTVARMFANFTPEQRLSDDMVLNLDRFSDEEIQAAMCAPLQPLYDLACANSTRRPVKSSLPLFQSPTRGGFSVYPSPSLTSITGGYGQWTSTDDANANATKAACQTIACATPVEYRIYGVYRCLTVKNLLQMTFPELVEAYLNRLAAAQARLAETLLLEAMGNGAVSIDAVTLGYGAKTTILATILNYIGLYAEIERWDADQMEAWMPRWVIKAIQKDVVSQRRTDGGNTPVPSQSTIEGWFRDAGVNPHFFMDRPSWATPIPPLATSSILNFLPRNLEILLAPRGKFAVMDRGELNIGVAPGNLYRDNVSNSRNEFTLFFENFEGVINTNTCPAHLLQLNDLCYNGQQIDDVALGCEGKNYVGIGS